MKSVCLSLFLSLPFLLFGQRSEFSRFDITDSIRVCNDTVCHIIDRGNTRVGRIHLAGKNGDIEDYYRSNRNNFIRHKISENVFVNALRAKYDFAEFSAKPRYERKKILRRLLRAESYSFKEADRLLRFLNIKDGDCDKDTLLHHIEVLQDYRTAVFLLEGFDNYFYFTALEQYDDSPNLESKPYYNGLLQNRAVIADYIDFLLRKDYINYSQALSPSKFIKGSTIYHDNDVFMPGFNGDRNYTGGLRFEVFTDYLRLNFLQGIFKKKYQDLSYRGVFFGIEGYTPYIRYDDTSGETVEILPPEERNALYKNDRPFASYEYFGVADYSMHHSGLHRTRTQYRIGLVGGDMSENLQTILHRDQTIKSQKVFGWENQIADGGRYGFNFDLHREWMLSSPEQDIFDFRAERLMRLREKAERYDYLLRATDELPRQESLRSKAIAKKLQAKKYADKRAKKDKRQARQQRNPQRHIYAGAGVSVGNFLSAAEVKLGITNLNFTQTDGNRNFRLVPGRNARWQFTGEVGLRYVVHDTSLEGFGLLNPFENDPTEGLPIDTFTLASNQINRLVAFANFGVAVRVKNATFFYRLTLHTRKFLIENQSRPYGPIYGWGTVGMNYSNLSLFNR